MKRLTLTEPKLSAYEIKLNLDERLDFLCLGRWLIQRIKGHKATTDDQLLAWALYQSRSHKAPLSVLELGAGKGTISLILSVLWPKTRFVGIEAFPESYELSLRNRKLNHLNTHFFPILGDLRDPKIIYSALNHLQQSTNVNTRAEKPLPDSKQFPGYELICGAPPFMPLGSGIMPQDQQRASGRFEIRGGIEAYLEAVTQLLAPNSTSRAFILMDGQSHERSLKAISQVPSLRLIGHCEVLPRPNQAPTYEIFELAHAYKLSTSPMLYNGSLQYAQASAPCSTLPSQLCQRNLHGEKWTDAYQIIREKLGFQTPNPPWIFVPARLGSTRLKHKALVNIHGKSMIRRVLDNLTELTPQVPLVLVSDAQEILAQAQNINHPRLYTQLIDQSCDSGSQRVLKAYERLCEKVDSEWIINVQGDEPFLPHESLEALIEALPHFARLGVYIATLASPLPTDVTERKSKLNTPSVVKVCLAQFEKDMGVRPHHLSCFSWNKALYFTRQATGTHQHIGVYAFHRNSLHLLESKRGHLAQYEDLEQLTWLESGAQIGVVCLKDSHLPGIDTPQDLEQARQHFQSC